MGTVGGRGLVHDDCAGGFFAEGVIMDTFIGAGAIESEGDESEVSAGPWGMERDFSVGVGGECLFGHGGVAHD